METASINNQRKPALGERGTTMLEYCFLAILCVMACIGGMAYVGQETDTCFSSVSDGFN